MQTAWEIAQQVLEFGVASLIVLDLAAVGMGSEPPLNCFVQPFVTRTRTGANYRWRDSRCRGFTAVGGGRL